MPTYEYKCDACGTAFERFQSITAAPVKKCPKCGKNKVRRLISTGAGLIFKGSGFYITDYRTDSYKSGEKAAEGSSSGTSSTNTDSKPAGDSKPSGDAKPSSDKPAPSSSSDSSSKPATPTKSESKSPPKKGDSKK